MSFVLAVGCAHRDPIQAHEEQGYGWWMSAGGSWANAAMSTECPTMDPRYVGPDREPFEGNPDWLHIYTDPSAVLALEV